MKILMKIVMKKIGKIYLKMLESWKWWAFMKEFEIVFHNHVPLVCNMYIPHQKVTAPQKLWHLFYSGHVFKSVLVWKLLSKWNNHVSWLMWGYKSYFMFFLNK
jgi:hypothetical protein